jgi:heme/copper-type cytochrome/quinol oxidase subunit 3
MSAPARSAIDGSPPASEAGRAKPGRSALDVSTLPPYALGARTTMFWGVVLLMAIETTMLALMVLAYFYVRGNFGVWPPTSMGRPAFRLATAGVLVLLASAIPNHLVNREITHGHVRRARWWVVATTLLGVVFLALRFVELRRLPVRWDTHAYGSVVWGILGLNIFHAVSAVLENLTLIALLFIGPVEKKHLHDLQLGGYFWYWLIAVWVPLYAIVYLEPMLFGYSS